MLCAYATVAVLLALLRYSRQSLKVLGTVGEPINPEAWLWYHKVIGNGKCAIVDTFWQTETVSVLSCVRSPVAIDVSVRYQFTTS